MYVQIQAQASISFETWLQNETGVYLYCNVLTQRYAVHILVTLRASFCLLYNLYPAEILLFLGHWVDNVYRSMYSFAHAIMSVTFKTAPLRGMRPGVVISRHW